MKLKSNSRIPNGSPIGNILSVCLFLFFLSSANAQQTITWDLTGNGFWDKASNWNPPQVPSAFDTVLITHDSIVIRNGIHAEAAMVAVGINLGSIPTGLAISATGSLTISDSDEHGLAIAGMNTTVRNAGLLNVQNIAVHAMQLREGLFENTESGSINIGPGIGAWGINNLLGATFKNDGSIGIKGTVGDAIHSTANVRNQGLIYIENAGDEGIHNNDTLLNFDTIRIAKANNGGIRNGKVFINDATGVILVDSSGIGLNNFSQFTNRNKMLLTNSTSYGMLHQINSIMVNDGYLSINKTGSHGIWINHQDGNFTNNDTLEIARSAGSGLLCFRGQMSNNGRFIITNGTSPMLDGISLDRGTFLSNGNIEIDGMQTGLKLTGIETEIGQFTINNGLFSISNGLVDGAQVLPHTSLIILNPAQLKITNSGDNFLMVDQEAIIDCTGILDMQN